MMVYLIDNLSGDAYDSALQYIADYVRYHYNVNFDIKDNVSDLVLIARLLKWEFDEAGKRVGDL